MFLYNIHPILQRQQLDYQIFIVEQAGKGDFNRAALMNVGYVEASKKRAFDCFVFQDVDLVPEDDRSATIFSIFLNLVLQDVLVILEIFRT